MKLGAGPVPHTPLTHVATWHCAVGCGQSATEVHLGPGGGLPTGAADATLVTIGADQTATAPTPILWSALRLEIPPLSVMATPQIANYWRPSSSPRAG